MALRNIVTEGDPILRKTCREVTEVNERMRILIDDMIETMRDANGVGLAAPQIGMMRRMFVAEPEPGEVYCFVNPQITEKTGSQESEEGCLSVPGQWGYVTRPAKVKVTAQNRYGKEIKVEGTEMLARALCHEIDHLNGVIFTDIADEMTEIEEKQ